jgi:hypothetical protein
MSKYFTWDQIRDLEARVELLSGNKEEIVYEMRMMLKGMLPFLICFVEH